MRTRLVLLALAWLLAPALTAKPKTVAYYTAGTLKVRTGRPAQLECEGGEFSVDWRDKQVLHIPYGRILFLESGSYRPKTVLGDAAFNSRRVLYFMTLIYQDDWSHTQILQLRLEGGYADFAARLGSTGKLTVHDGYSDVTALSKGYGANIPASEHSVKLWSSTDAKKPITTTGVLRLPAGATPEIVLGKDARAIPYANIKALEYTQVVSINKKKLIALGVITEGYGALFSRWQVHHLLTVTYVEDGASKTIVVEFPKYTARTLIMEFELRSGRRVEVNSQKVAENIYG